MTPQQEEQLITRTPQAASKKRNLECMHKGHDCPDCQLSSRQVQGYMRIRFLQVLPNCVTCVLWQLTRHTNARLHPTSSNRSCRQRALQQHACADERVPTCFCCTPMPHAPLCHHSVCPNTVYVHMHQATNPNARNVCATTLHRALLLPPLAQGWKGLPAESDTPIMPNQKPKQAVPADAVQQLTHQHTMANTTLSCTDCAGA